MNSEADSGRFPLYRVTVNDPLEGQIALITFMSPEEIDSIGGVPPEIIVGRQVQLANGLNPDNFERNLAFIEFLHGVVRQSVPSIKEFAEFVRTIPSGWFNVQDGRTTLNGLPLPPEDLIGRYRVLDGRFLVGEYEPNPGYWVLTENGMMTPHPAIVNAVLDAMRRLKFTQGPAEPTSCRFRWSAQRRR